MDESNELISNQPAKIYTVSTLTAAIKDLLEAQFHFLWLEGEISNFKAPASGHYYMSLKDENAQIRAVMFKPQSRYLKFKPQDGMKVIAQGRIGLYEPRGEYQIILDYLEPLGIGALALALDQLKKKLAAQGVFDPALKKPLPFLPQKVAVITSPTGAAIRDFLKIIHRRFANIRVIIVPVKVQGDEATAEMVEALEIINKHLDVDVIVLTRGGGSLEDLWAFNQESLALAIRASRIPVVSAVGHEIDITIADLAADLRAPTPSAAAEMIVAEKEAIKKRLSDRATYLQLALKNRLAQTRQRLDFLSRRLLDPRKRLTDAWLRLDELQERMIRLMTNGIKTRKQRLTAEGRTLMLHAPLHLLSALRQKLIFQTRSMRMIVVNKLGNEQRHVSFLLEKLNSLSPLAILKRGYSLTRTIPQNAIVKKAGQVQKGNSVNILLGEGELECTVEKVKLF